jgi:Skp family chaperone for outer membrane proteins
VGVGLQAESGALPLDKIGVVDTVRVMSQSKLQSEMMGSLSAQHGQHQAELEALSTELDTDQAALQTMVPGSEDHLRQLKIVIDKKAILDSHREYYQQLLSSKERDFTEKIYRGALEATGRIAEARGLMMVLDKSAPQFPIPAERLLFVIGSNKVLYSKGCIDITDAVLAEMNK